MREPPCRRRAVTQGAGGPHVAGLCGGHDAHGDRVGAVRGAVQLRRGGRAVQFGGYRLSDSFRVHAHACRKLEEA